MSLHSQIYNNGKGTQHRSELSRRAFCKGLGLIGVAVLLGGCEGFPVMRLRDPGSETSQGQTFLTPEEFKEEVGSFEEIRLCDKMARDAWAPNACLQRFLIHSPRIQMATAGSIIGSVLNNPTPVIVESAVKLQLARARGEPELLHNDLGKMAATQYKQWAPYAFASVFPNNVYLIGDRIHKSRSILQLAISGKLPSEKIVRTNEDLESFLGRQLTFADLMVHGVYYGKGITPIKSTDIRVADHEGQRIPEGAVSLSLVPHLIRLVVAGEEVLAITPYDPHERPSGWQNVSDEYRNFAVGQLLEAEMNMTEHSPRNDFEKAIVADALGEYRPCLADGKERLGWSHTCNEIYQVQKQDRRADLMVQPVILHRQVASKQLG